MHAMEARHKVDQCRLHLPGRSSTSCSTMGVARAAMAMAASKARATAKARQALRVAGSNRIGVANVGAAIGHGMSPMWGSPGRHSGQPTTATASVQQRREVAGRFGVGGPSPFTATTGRPHPRNCRWCNCKGRHGRRAIIGTMSTAIALQPVPGAAIF